MKFFYYIVTILFLLHCSLAIDNKQVHLRRKRYVAFPEGSSLIVALCATVQLVLPFQIFTEGINWGMSYDLPNATVYKDTKKLFLQRRHRRDLYNRMETIIDSMGYDGRACILRTLCEAPRRLISKENTLSEDILRLLFKFPLGRVRYDEPEDHRIYHWAYNYGMENKQQDCDEIYPTCKISLIDLALGYYDDYS